LKKILLITVCKVPRFYC